MPQSIIDDLRSQSPGFVESRIAYWSAEIDAKLAKRYAVPFASPYPIVIERWVTDIVTVEALIRRGIDPNDAQFVEMSKAADIARASIASAADGKDGSYELPLRADTTVGGISKEATLGYSEQGPFASAFDQARAGRDEMASRLR